MASILIVDDVSFVRKVLGAYLRKLGHEVVGEAANAEDAIELYKNLRPDLVTMDIVLEGDANGLTALDNIRIFDSTAKVIMISSHGHVDVVKKAMDLGAKGFIEKPVDGSTLDDMINKILNISSKRVSLHL